ncbi:MAG: hypothetical protein M9887_11775 [Chitinophagales bacterium]|nr:hypothetical protein [Chitinophagales bacterium]
MRFRYRKSYIYLGLFLGVIWTVWGIDYIVMSHHYTWLGILFLPFGFYLLIKLYFDYTNKYVSINTQSVKVFNFPFRTKELQVGHLEKVKRLGTHFIFESENKTIKVSKRLLHKEDLIAFEKIFREIEQIVHSSISNIEYQKK